MSQNIIGEDVVVIWRQAGRHYEVLAIGGNTVNIINALKLSCGASIHGLGGSWEGENPLNP